MKSAERGGRMEKLKFEGRVKAVQPRIRLGRSFDLTHHNYLGYAILVEGSLDDEPSVIWVGIGKGTQSKFQFKVHDQIQGECLPVADDRLERVGYYKVSKLTKAGGVREEPSAPPPWKSIPPELEIYRARGHRRLDTRTYNRKCQTCMWGCRMPVEITVDHWNPGILEYRFETFCYGPKSCPFYKAGENRKVPGRNGMVYHEEDWVDEENTRNRDEDE